MRDRAEFHSRGAVSWTRDQHMSRHNATIHRRPTYPSAINT